MGPARISALVAALVALLGCEPPPDTVVLQPAACPSVVYDQPIPVPATSTTKLIDTRAAIHAAPNPDGISVDITDNQGTIAYLGSDPIPAFIYERTPWEDLNTTLYAGLGITDGAWIPFWLYCSPDGKLTGFFAERTDQTTTVDLGVDGTCEEVLGDWEMPVDVPAHELRGVALTCGYSVRDASSLAPISLMGSQAGVASVYGSPMTVLVFTTVDCRSGCGSSKWFELHSIVWEPTSGQVGFTIWYLEGETSGTGVIGANGVVFPSAGFADIAYPTAAWSIGH